MNISNNCQARKHFMRVSWKQILPFDIEPIEGYRVPINEFTGAIYPFHNKLYEKHYNNIQDWYENEFPNCCELHKAVAKKKGFQKKKYRNVAMRVMRQISYTEYFIKKKKNQENWYKEITDYIEYNYISFGDPYIGIERYIGFLHRQIQVNAYQLSDEQNKKLEVYISYLLSGVDIEAESQLRIKQFNRIYRKWLKFLPDLEIFSNAKEKLASSYSADLIYETKEYNPYLGSLSGKVRTVEEMLDQLNELTNIVLNSVNTHTYFQDSPIEQKNYYQKKLNDEKHRVSQSDLLKTVNGQKVSFLKTIKRWLKREKEWMDEEVRLYLEREQIEKQHSRKTTPNKDITFKALFRHNEDNIKKFISLLIKEMAISEKLNNGKYIWQYNKRKSSIVACFEAAKTHGIIKEVTSKSELRRVIGTRFDFEGNEKLFRGSINQLDFSTFLGYFEKAFPKKGYKS